MKIPLAGCEIRLLNSWIVSGFFGKLRVETNVFLRNCQPTFLMIKYFFLPNTKLLTESKAKAFFSNNVNVEGSPRNVINTHKKRSSRNFTQSRPNNKIDQRSQNYTQRQKWVWLPPPTPTPRSINNPPF